RHAHPPPRDRARRRARRVAAPRDPRPVGRPLDARARARAQPRARGTLAEPRGLSPPTGLRRPRRRSQGEPALARAERRLEVSTCHAGTRRVVEPLEACGGGGGSPPPGDPSPPRVGAAGTRGGVKPLEACGGRTERPPAAAPAPAGVAGVAAQGQAQGTTAGAAGAARDVAGHREPRAPAPAPR